MELGEIMYILVCLIGCAACVGFFAWTFNDILQRRDCIAKCFDVQFRLCGGEQKLIECADGLPEFVGDIETTCARLCYTNLRREYI